MWKFWKECPNKVIEGSLDVSDVAMSSLIKGTSRDMENFFVVAWSIWYNRNQMVYESLCQSPSQIWGFASRLLNDYKEVFKLSPHVQTNSEIG